MILTCPNCATQYQVDAEAFAQKAQAVEGVRVRLVRCKNCSMKWYQPVNQRPALPTPKPEAAREAPPPSEPPRVIAVPPPPTVRKAEPAPEPKAEPVKASAPPAAAPVAGERKRRPILASIAWVMLFLIVGGFSYSAYAYRQSIVDAWPEASSAYALLSIPVNSRGLEFRGVTYDVSSEDGLPVLAVSGEVVNLARRSLEIPKIRIALRDSRQQEIYSWTIGADEAQLSPGEASAFKTRLSSPPPDAFDLKVSFVRPDV